jgi:hypothetical protein
MTDESVRPASPAVDAVPVDAVRADAGPTPVWRQRNVRRGLAGAGIFLIGAAVGSLVTSHVVFNVMRRGLREPEAVAEHMLSRMRHDLDLTDEQAAAMKPILTERLGAISKALTDGHDAMHAAIAELLTPEQRAVHEEHVARMRRRFLGGGPDKKCSGRPLPAPE